MIAQNWSVHVLLIIGNDLRRTSHTYNAAATMGALRVLFGGHERVLRLLDHLRRASPLHPGAGAPGTGAHSYAAGTFGGRVNFMDEAMRLTYAGASCTVGCARAGQPERRRAGAGGAGEERGPGGGQKECLGCCGARRCTP